MYYYEVTESNGQKHRCHEWSCTAAKRLIAEAVDAYSITGWKARRIPDPEEEAKS